jgi:hypothetical protein
MSRLISDKCLRSSSDSAWSSGHRVSFWNVSGAQTHDRGLALPRSSKRSQAVAPAQGQEQLPRPRIRQRVCDLFVGLAAPTLCEAPAASVPPPAASLLAHLRSSRPRAAPRSRGASPAATLRPSPRTVPEIPFVDDPRLALAAAKGAVLLAALRQLWRAWSLPFPRASHLSWA